MFGDLLGGTHFGISVFFVPLILCSTNAHSIHPKTLWLQSYLHFVVVQSASPASANKVSAMVKDRSAGRRQDNNCRCDYDAREGDCAVATGE